MKKVLVLCAGNSCRSIIAEALINSNLEGISAQNSGVKANGKELKDFENLFEQIQEVLFPQITDFFKKDKS